MKTIIVVIFSGIFIVNRCEEILNDKIKHDGNKDTITARRYSEDRFVQNLDDDEWHVAHLKYTEMDGRRNCVGDTFKDRARRYREMLRRDGALVEYVDADPLPLDETDLLKKDICKLEIEDYKTSEDRNKQKLNPKIANKHFETDKIEITKDSLKGTNNTEDVAKDINMAKDSNTEKFTTPNNDFKATTSTRRVVEETREKNESKKDDNRRASEYIFSSVEYYDDTPNFDESVCPDLVEVIELEIDELRSYDVVCERMIEWRNLE